MALTWKAFLESALEIGALTDSHQDQLNQLSIALEADAKEPARWLVEHRLLTPFQAGTIYQGKAASLVLGNYLLLDRLGEGGFGQVFRARHRRMDRIVAVKLMSRQALASPQALQMFQREVKATARLVHPNIVTAFDADEYHGVHFFVMEHVEGHDLSWHVKKSGPLAPHLALNYIVQAARGLDHAHKHGVVHRDIKSSNLLLDQQGTIKILDLGIAQFGGETQDPAQQNAAAGASGASSVGSARAGLNRTRSSMFRQITRGSGYASPVPRSSSNIGSPASSPPLSSCCRSKYWLSSKDARKNLSRSMLPIQAESSSAFLIMAYRSGSNEPLTARLNRPHGPSCRPPTPRTRPNCGRRCATRWPRPIESQLDTP